MMMNLRGDERVLSVYWIFILVIVTLSIVAGVVQIYGGDLDVRAAEAGLLKERAVDCLVHKGVFDRDKFDLLSDADALLQECKIDLVDRSSDQEEVAFALLLAFDGVEKSFGDSRVLDGCPLSLAGREESVCVIRKLYVLERDVGKFLEITAGVKKDG
jgi:hypothetical protein